jgi:glycosyltransferase involved in cell wall biosynthesis
MLGGENVVVVHDYVTQRGGAERVVLELLRAFPGARLVTSCWNPATSYPEFRDHEIDTLWINRIAPLRRDPRLAFPFLARAFRHRSITDADVVICSSSGWAHRVTAAVPKIVYCHNPARWLYQPDDYLSSSPRWVRSSFVRATGRMRRTDAAAARSAAAYVVNSSVVAGRVRASYGIEPTVVPPARGLSPDGPQRPVPDVEPGYLLTVSRQRGYKRTEAVRAAVALMPGERLVVVGGEPDGTWRPGITGVSNIDDAQLRWLYANASGVIAVAQEDFGLIPVEAQSFGVPSVVLRSGGYVDSTVEDVTGVFVDDAGVSQISAGIRALRERAWDGGEIRRLGERFSPTSFAQRMQGVVAEVLTSQGRSRSRRD